MTSRPDSTRWWLLAGLALVAFKLWLAASQTICAVGAAGHDDRLYLILAQSLLRGDWLGPYSHMTLIKGPMYSLWIAGVFLTGVPLFTAQHLLYAAAAALLVSALRPALPSRWLGLLLFAVLLFNPVTTDTLIHSRVLRQHVYQSFTLGTVAGLIALCLRARAPLRQLMPWSALAGASLGAFWLTREEGVWLTPLLVLLWGWLLWTLWREAPRDLLRRSLLMLSPLLIFAAMVLTVCTLNLRYYGVFATVEFKAAPFEDAYGALARVTPRQWRASIPVPRETRERIYAVSPAFAELRPWLEGPIGDGWSVPGEQWLGLPHNQREIAAGWFMWALRDATAAAGHAHSGREAMAFYRKIADEVNAACDQGRLAAGPRRSGFVPVWHHEYLAPMCRSFLRGCGLFFSFNDIKVTPTPSSGPPANLLVYTDLTRGRLTPMPDEPHLPPQQSWLDRVRLPLLASLVKRYQSVAPFAAILAGFVWLVASFHELRRRRISIWFVLNLGLLGSIGVMMLINALIDATAFPSIATGAFTACYPLYIIFLFTAWLQWLARPAGAVSREDPPVTHPTVGGT